MKPEWFKLITQRNFNGNSIKQHVHPGSLKMQSLELTRFNWGGNYAQLPRHLLCESLPSSETSLLEQEEAHLIRHKQHWNRKTPHPTQLTITFHSNLMNLAAGRKTNLPNIYSAEIVTKIIMAFLVLAEIPQRRSWNTNFVHSRLFRSRGLQHARVLARWAIARP